tara:strand:+ start:3779 stop:5944 length:2166 start_codon:yes stop_codon:yes gene_type:complete
LDNIEGVVKKVKYLNEKSHWGVIEFLKNDGKKFIARGNMGAQQQGYRLRLAGRWVNNDRGGGQVYDVSSFQVLPPESKEGIYLFLTSGLFDGFTKPISRELVDTYGDNTLKLLDHNPNILLTIKGVGPKRFIRMRDSYMDNKPLQERLFELMNKYKFTFTEALLIVNECPENAVDILENAPYSLYKRVGKIPFLRFDQVIMSMGVDKHDPHRIREVIIYQMRSSHRDGHTLIPLSALKKKVIDYLGIDVYLIDREIHFLLDKRWIFSSSHPRFGTVLQSEWFYSAEKEIANRLGLIMGMPAEKDLVFDPEYEGLAKLKSHQRRAVVAPFEHKVSIITGRPGAGKTTLLRTILELLELQNLSVLAVSPTGKAAERLREVTSRECSTIHRALGATHQSDEFIYNDLQPLDFDVIVIDETSMLDTSILRALLRATKLTSRIIFIGDVEQLPSVSPGAVFRDMINSGCFAVYWLTEVLRIKGKNGVKPTPLIVADAVREGGFPFDLPNDDEWSFYPTSNNKETKSVLADVVNKLKSEKVPYTDVQVFSPVNEDELGVDALNLMVKKSFFPEGKDSMEVGDKVMQLRNNYDLDVYNGVVGLVDFINESKERLRKDEAVMSVSMSGRTVDFTRKDSYDLVLAYAITGHKSQGSEYPHVIIVLPEHFFSMMDRYWFYTLITRCQKKVHIIGNSNVIGEVVRNKKSHLRQTLLMDKLRQFSPVINVVHK